MKLTSSLPAMKSSGLSWSIIVFALAALLVIILKK